MGDAASCCSVPEKPDLTVREIVTLEGGDAYKQAMAGRYVPHSGFFNKHEKIKEVFDKKPPYCYKIDRKILVQK